MVVRSWFSMCFVGLLSVVLFVWSVFVQGREVFNLKAALEDPSLVKSLNLDARKNVQMVSPGGQHFLSCNDATIPPNLEKFINLERLNLSCLLPMDQADDYQPAFIPSYVFGLKSLVELDLSFNRLMSIPSEISKLTNLEKLDLSQNSIAEISADIGKLRKLTKLDVSDRANVAYEEVVQFPEGLLGASSLLILDMSNYKLDELPAEIELLQNLKELDVSDNLLTSIPAELWYLESLERLDLSGNDLLALPHGIEKLTKLRALDLRGVKKPPEGIDKLISLRELTLSDAIPPGAMWKLNTFEMLNIYLENDVEIFESLPTELDKISRINLYLKGGWRCQEETELLEKIAERQYKLVEFSSNCYETSGLPRALFEIVSLENLEITLSIDAQETLFGLSKLVNMSELSINHHAPPLKSLPKEIIGLGNLDTLRISWNLDDPLPQGLVELPNLKKLGIWLFSNHQVIPYDELSKLSVLNLDELVLGYASGYLDYDSDIIEMLFPGTAVTFQMGSGADIDKRPENEKDLLVADELLSLIKVILRDNAKFDISINDYLRIEEKKELNIKQKVYARKKFIEKLVKK